MLMRLILIVLTLATSKVENAFGEDSSTKNEGSTSTAQNAVPEADTKISAFDEIISQKLADTLFILEEYMALKLGVFDRKMEKFATSMDEKFSATQKMFHDLDQRINTNYEKLEKKIIEKIEEGNRKYSCNYNCIPEVQARIWWPGKPILSTGKRIFTIIQVDKNAIAYNDLVKRNDFAEVSVSWTISGSVNLAETSKVTLNGTEVWSGESDETSASFRVEKGGRFLMRVERCNRHGCSHSATTKLIVADTDGSHLPPLEYSIEERNKPFKQTSGKVVAGYFVEWGAYDRNYPVDRVPVPNLTHLLYSYINICGGDGINVSAKKFLQSLLKSCKGRDDFKVTIRDSWAALRIPRKGLISESNPYRGNFGQLMMLKQAKPDLKILPSIGGASMSDPFFFFTDKTKRATFVASVKDFLQTWKFFDGVNIVWEYPGSNNAKPHMGSPEDGTVYVLLMKELREMLNELTTETGKKYELTSAISAAWNKIKVVDYGEAQKYMDHIFLMSYDFKGAWSNVTLGYQGSLYAPSWNPNELYTTDYGVKCLLAQGVNPEKIVVGISMRGQGWTGVYNYTDNNPFTGNAKGPVNGTWQDGAVDYKDIVKRTAQGQWEYHYDQVAEAPYIFRKATGDLITYEDANSTIAKGKYVRDNGLGGLFAWELDSDNGDLLNAMNYGLGNSL